MPGYQVKYETVTVRGTDYRIRSLLDLQQYADPDGCAERAGISPASWPLFGHLWPSARVLAKEMAGIDLAGKRVLEMGAGLALASLVIHGRTGDATVTDWHPLSEAFLLENLALNGMAPLKFQLGDWGRSNPALGRFDLIIGSDLLYERQQPGLLAGFVRRHAEAKAQVIIVDPNRGNRSGFCREMAEQGFSLAVRRAPPALENGQPYKGRFLIFARGGHP